MTTGKTTALNIRTSVAKVTSLLFNMLSRFVIGKIPGEGNTYQLQYSGLENSMDREPGQLQSMGSQRVRHDWATFTFNQRCTLCPLPLESPSHLPPMAVIFKITFSLHRKPIILALPCWILQRKTVRLPQLISTRAGILPLSTSHLQGSYISQPRLFKCCPRTKASPRSWLEIHVFSPPPN